MATKVAKPSVDPVTLSVVWNKLLTITRETGYRVMFSAQSFVMGMVQDLGPVLIDPEARVLTQCEFLPSHTLVASTPSKIILSYFGNKLNKGDFVIANDGSIIKSGHLPDWTFMRPMYWHDELVCYCYFRGHQMDTGGALSGGYFPRAYDCIAEGLNIPPVKIINKGKINEELYGLILRNVRSSPAVRADNMVIYGSMTRTEQEIAALVDKYGLDTIRACFKEMIKAAEEGMRAEIKKIPDGEYYGETALDWDGSTPEAVWIRVKLTVKGDEMTFDFSDSDAQRDFINSPLGNTECFTFLAVFLTVDPNIPRNHGSMMPVKVIAPEGKVVHVTRPHTYGACACSSGTEICEACLQALGKAVPDKAAGAWHRHFSSDIMGRYSTIDPRTGMPEEFFAAPFVEGGGTGAVKGYDGWEGYGGHTTGGTIYRGSVEHCEMFLPFHWHTVRLLKDTEGPGEFTGATGLYGERMSSAPADARITIMTGDMDGLDFPPCGQAGAPYPPLPQQYIQRVGKKTRKILRTFDMVPFYPGDNIITIGGGGGGWGNPLNRDPEMVRQDVVGLKVSIKRARNVYGVIIKPRSLKVDYKATEKLRKLMKTNPLHNTHIDQVRDDVRSGKMSVKKAREIYGVVMKDDRGRMVIDFKETQKLRNRMIAELGSALVAKI